MKKIKLPSRLTLKLARELCLKQWRWIVKQIRAGDPRSVNDLKSAWVNDNIIGKNVPEGNCFYCEYTSQGNRDGLGCAVCPGRKIDPNFDCMGDDYYYSREPEKFYKELLRHKRLEKKS